jgi:hypothetical protein
MWHDDAVEWTQPLRKRRWPTTRAARFATQAHRRRERVADERSHAQREDAQRTGGDELAPLPGP